MEARTMQKWRQMGCKILQNLSKILPSEVQNLWKSGHEDVLERFGAILAASGRSLAHLAPRLGSWADLGSKMTVLGSILALGFQMGPQICQNPSQERSEILSFLSSIWRSTFEAIWSELGPILDPQNLPKMKPSWLQNRFKLGCWFESCFLMDVRLFFIDFCA